MSYKYLIPVILLIACGNDGPTAPTNVTTTTTPIDRAIQPGTVLTFVSAETDAPVGNATVVAAGRSYTTDASGQVTLSERVPFGGLLDVSTSDYLDRQTLVGSKEETRFTLFPKHSPTGLDEAFTLEILYTSSVTGERRRMGRLPPGTTDAWVIPSSQIRNDVIAMRFVDGAAQMITEATRGQVTFHVSDSAPPGALYYDLVIDSNAVRERGENIIAFAEWRLNSWAVVGGTVRYLSMDWVRSPATVHERVDRFSLREQLLMSLMLKRRPGNAHPDNDREAPAQWRLGAGEETIRIIACPY